MFRIFERTIWQSFGLFLACLFVLEAWENTPLNREMMEQGVSWKHPKPEASCLPSGRPVVGVRTSGSAWGANVKLRVLWADFVWLEVYSVQGAPKQISNNLNTINDILKHPNALGKHVWKLRQVVGKFSKEMCAENWKTSNVFIKNKMLAHLEKHS